MKNLIHVFYLVIILILVYYFRGGFTLTESAPTPSTTIEKAAEPQMLENTLKVEKVVIEKPTGTVKAKICYPSEFIPALENYLVEVDTGEIIQVNSEINTSQVNFLDVPAGTYKAVAYIPSDYEYPGGYTEFVPCGLSVDCEDHSYIEFSVENSKTTEIEFCDWYGADPLPIN